MTIFFRFNCGHMWGLGHLYRNRELITKLSKRGYRCIAVINHEETAIEMLRNSDIEFLIVPEFETAEYLISRIIELSSLNETVVFWDRLDSTFLYIKQLVDSGLRLITYDDYDASSLYASAAIVTRDILIDGKPLLYAGPKYQLLRNDIKEYAIKKKNVAPVPQKILLHFGGTDPLDILSKCFYALKTENKYEFIFIAGKEEPNKYLKEELSGYGNISYYEGVPNFSQYIFNVDICVLAGGVSMYESAAIGTPMIIISHNQDQDFAASIFEKNGCCINLGIADQVTDDQIRNTIKTLSGYQIRKDMSKRMKAFVPVDGIENVCNVIEGVINK